MNGEGTVYVLGSEELAVLLASFGKQKLPGFLVETVACMKREDIVYALHTLYRQGLIAEPDQGGAVRVESELSRLVSICVLAQKTIRITRLEPCKEAFAYCCWDTGGWACLRPCETRQNGWRLHGIGEGRLTEFLQESGCLPAYDGELQRSQEQLSAYWRFREEEERTALRLLLRMECTDAERTPLIIEVGLGVLEYFIVAGCEDSIQRQPYSQERLENILRGWMEEDG